MIGGIIGSVATNVIGGALSGGKKSEESENPIMKLLAGVLGGGKKEEQKNPIEMLMSMADPMKMLGGGEGGGLSLLG